MLEGLNEIFLKLLETYSIDKGFEIVGIQIQTISLLYIYTIAAAACLIYIIFSLIIGEVVEFFSIDDDGNMPAVALAMGIFAAFGGLSLIFFETTPQLSIAYGLGGAVFTFLLVVYTLKWLGRNQSNLVFNRQSLEGKTGICRLPIEKGKSGLVEINIGGGGERFTAWSDSKIKNGEAIKVVEAISGREVRVESL